MRMKNVWSSLVSVVSVLCLCGAGVLVAAESVATKPAPRDGEKWWGERHAQQVENTAKGGAELLMIGDSITQGWEGAGKAVWEKYYAPRKALNLGISGDRTEHVLWRLDNLPLDKINPKAAIIMIGTNNIGHGSSSPAEAAEGIKAIVDKLHKAFPKMHIVVLKVFPRDEKPDGAMRAKVNEINELFPKLLTKTKKEHVTIIDISDKFLTSDGVLTKEVMPDALHPNTHGYEIWAEAIEPVVKKVLGEKADASKGTSKPASKPRATNAARTPRRATK
ncbi:MAG: platelet-activating factor acetylhydrolase IB subunit [Thermoguttaceae bacterium]